jgi:hypothetical protein
MSTDNMVDDGESTFYRVRIRFADEDDWSQWYRPSAAPADYLSHEEAEQKALKCWRIVDAKRCQVQVIKVRMSIEPVARIEPAHVVRMRDL